MQPAFAGSYKTVAIPFGSRVTGYLPRERPLVKNGSFGDRFVEGIYLHADHDTPCIRMYCITSGSELLVQDFKSYPDEFSFRDPSCLLRCILKDLAKMHIDDVHDDNLVAEETDLHAHTRAQTRKNLIPSKYRAFNQNSTQSCAQLPNKSSLALTRESVLKRWSPGCG